MEKNDINTIIAMRYKKWSKISLKIGLASFVISFIIIVVNTGNSTMSFISSIGLVITISCIMEYAFLTILCRYFLDRNKDEK